VNTTAQAIAEMLRRSAKVMLLGSIRGTLQGAIAPYTGRLPYERTPVLGRAGYLT
jgi:hypothetical protein